MTATEVLAFRFKNFQLVWSKRLARPFESDAAFVAKLAWLSDIRASKKEAFEWKVKRNTSALASICSDYTEERNLLHHPLAQELYKNGLQICYLCLLTGFHSAVPQLLGMVKCPIHNTAFQKTCFRCSAPIAFGIKQFNSTGVFNCRSCGHVFDESSKPFLKRVGLLSNQRIQEAFKPYLPRLKDAECKCRGYWRVVKKDAPFIYQYITGSAPSFVSEHFDAYSIYKEMNVSTFTLPVEPNELERRLRFIQDVNRKRLGKLATSQSDEVSTSLEPVINLRDSAIEVYPGMDLVQATFAVHKEFERRVVHGNSHFFVPLYDLPKTFHSGDKKFPGYFYYNQLKEILIACSHFQIYKQLQTAAALAASIIDQESLADSATCRASWAVNTESGEALMVNIVHHDRVQLHIPDLCWLPSFHIQLVEGQEVLQVFQYLKLPVDKELTTVTL